MFLETIALVLLLSLGSSTAKSMSWETTQLEDEAFFGRLLGITGSLSMSIPDGGDCVDDFDTIESLVESSKVSSDILTVRLCRDSLIKFERSIDMTDANFAMMCENNACQLDGQGRTHFFEAGPFDSGRKHMVTFDTIQFFNGNTTRAVGGAIIIVGGQARFHECAFVNNYGSDGGAMYIQDGVVTIADCLFQSNNAEDVGGAMKVEESISGILDLTIRDTTFIDNVADTEADDIYHDVPERGSIDCGEGSGNQFCGALPSSTAVSTNWPTSVCAGASTGDCSTTPGANLERQRAF